MKKNITITAILNLTIVTLMVVTPTVVAMPGIKRPMDFYVAAIQGNSPKTVDYSWAYDTASGEIIQNTMDTLIQFNGEHINGEYTDQFVGSLAWNWTTTPIYYPGGIDTGIPIDGLNFENRANQSRTAKIYYRYEFDFNTSVPIYFQTLPNGTKGYLLTAEDVVYSFQRTLVQDRLAGPSWMLYEPLLDNNVGGDQYSGGMADLSNTTQVAELGQLINNSVVINPSSSSEIWFNLMFPGAYAPFMQILTQTWSSVISRSWVRNEVISQAGRPDWDGDWSTFTAWVNCHNPPVSPLDSPTPMEYGSGPYCLVPGTPDYVNNFWAMTRNIGYFKSWPASFPQSNTSRPQGYVNTVEETWNFAWAAASQLFKNGDADFVAVPSTSYINQLYQNETPPFDPPNYPQNGIRCIHPLPELAVDAMFFTFNIYSATPLQTLCRTGTFDPNAIPPDFFGNTKWGIHVRRAFAYAFDHASFIATAVQGEGATQPLIATALIPGLRYYDQTIAHDYGFNYNLTRATQEFNQVPGLMSTGFTLNLIYDTGNLERKTACDLIASALTAINSKFKTVEINVTWNSYLTAAVYSEMPLFIIGWQLDFPDAHDFVLPFYHTGGTFASWQAYSNSRMDALIDRGILTPDDLTPHSSASGHHERQDIYDQVQQLALDDVPSFTILQPASRHFERDWCVGWYYNQAYPGGYYYNLWKWYYVTPAMYSVSSTDNLDQPNSTNLPCDVNYDGHIDITDVATVAKAFGSIYGPPISPGWIQKGDINNDRKIDITDVTFVAKQFYNKTTPQSQGKWSPQGLTVSVVPVIRIMAAGSSQQFNSTVIGGTGPYTYAWFVLANSTNFPVDFDSVKKGTPVATTPNYVFTSPANDVWYMKLYVNDSGTNTGESTIITVLSAPLTITISPATLTLNMTLGERGDSTSDVAGGTPPYSYLWFTKNDTGVHDWVIAYPTTYGNTSPKYRFSSRKGQGSNSPGTWELKCQVTDSSTPTPVALNSTASIITVVT